MFFPPTLLTSFLASPITRYVALAAALLAAGYVKGCVDESAKRIRLEQRIKTEQEQNRVRVAAEILQRNASTDRREADHETIIAGLRADLERVSNPAPGSGVRPLSEAASVLACPDRQADVTARLARLEAGILARLVGRGNEAIVRTITAREWLLDQGLVPRAEGLTPPEARRPDTGRGSELVCDDMAATYIAPRSCSGPPLPPSLYALGDQSIDLPLSRMPDLSE